MRLQLDQRRDRLGAFLAAPGAGAARPPVMRARLDQVQLVRHLVAPVVAAVIGITVIGGITLIATVRITLVSIVGVTIVVALDGIALATTHNLLH